MSTLTLTEAFARHGAKLKNHQWSVCAESKDGSLVVCLWEHHIHNIDKTTASAKDTFSRWSGAGNNEFRAKVAQAFATGQDIKLVISHTTEADAVQAGIDASTIKKTFSIKEDWVGKVSAVVGDDYEFRFVKI